MCYVHLKDMCETKNLFGIAGYTVMLVHPKFLVCQRTVDKPPLQVLLLKLLSILFMITNKYSCLFMIHWSHDNYLFSLLILLYIIDSFAWLTKYLPIAFSTALLIVWRSSNCDQAPSADPVPGSCLIHRFFQLSTRASSNKSTSYILSDEENKHFKTRSSCYFASSSLANRELVCADKCWSIIMMYCICAFTCLYLL